MLYIVIFALIYLCSINAAPSFIKEGKRPEFFELTDNEIATFKIYILDEDFSLLKNQANYTCDRAGIPTLNIHQELDHYKGVLTNFLELLVKVNFNEMYPGINFFRVIPDLIIADNGYSHISVDLILKDFKFNYEYYRNNDFVSQPFIYQLFTSNPNFNLIKIAHILDQLEMAEGVQWHPDIQAVFDLALNSVNYKEFKTKNTYLVVEMGGNEIEFNKITFALGGKTARCFSKPAYNIKIGGGEDLFGSKNFRLRSESSDPSFIRSKLTSDVYQRLELPTVSTSYVTFYINDEYMGLYTATNAYKPFWFDEEYDDDDMTSLYKCDNQAFLTLKESYNICRSKNKKDNDNNTDDFKDILMKFDSARSASDLENVFEIDYFLKAMALEYVLGSWDHLFRVGHNYYMYKQPDNNKWIYLPYDFDQEFGINIDKGYLGPIILDNPQRIQRMNFDYLNYSLEDWDASHVHLIDVLIRRDPSRFNKILKEVVESTFNPDVLFPRIDKLKELIKPYVTMDYTPLENGKFPGRINDLGDEFYNYRQWEANVEFTSVPTDQYFAYGVKYWILEKYRYLCKTYDLKCNRIFLNESYEYSVDQEIEFKGYDWSIYFPDYDMNSPPSTTEFVAPTTTLPLGQDNWIRVNPSDFIFGLSSTSSTTLPNTTVNPITTTADLDDITPTPQPIESSIKCMAELDGYSCCPQDSTTKYPVYEQDEYGDWSYDFQTKKWCGLTPYNEVPIPSDKNCWSEELGYPCCKGCVVYEVDNIGSWGYESHSWCGIQTYCKGYTK